ncbi:phospholipid-transporting ATPase ABCA3-like [Epargyreus clarus]|uniref:phospholipid-transporting ATPase ABCA3-like n=1 Tax=Epargyreus clarus TaxID=520877 RepID=UPI003C2E2C08
MEKIGDDDVGFLKRLLVLIWRHAIVRVRRYILTIAEFVVPILLFMILFTFKDDINPKPKSFVVDKFNIRNTEPMMLDDFQPPTQIYYHPLTNYTELIMNKTCEQLYPKQQNRRELGRKTNAIPVTDINEFLRSDSILDKNVALVEFLHMEGETWPASLDYTIRMNQKFQTYLTLPQSGEIGPHENFGTVYKEFMRLQWAIDTSYIKLLSGTDIKQRVSLQEFPYVRLQENMAVELVSVLAAILCWMALLLPFMSLLTRLVEEKVSGIQDMLRMVGVKPEDVFASHIINMLPAALVFSVGVPILLTSTSNPLVRHSSAGLMGLVLALHFFTLVFVAFVLSYAFKSMQYVTSISAYVYAALWLPLLVLPARAVPWLRPLLALLPDVPLQWYWRELAALEKLGTCVCVPWLRPLLALLPDVPLQWYWRELAALEKLGTCVCVPWLRPLLALLPDVPLQWYWRELAALEKLGTCVCVPWLRPLLALLPDVPLQWYWRELAALEKLGTCVCVPWLRPLLALLPDVPLQWYWRELAALEKLGTCVCVPWLRPLLALLPDVPLQWYWRELAALEKLGTCVCVPWLRPLLALLPDVPLQWYWRELAALEKLGTCVCVPWLRPLLALLPDVPLQWYWRELAALEKLGTCVCVPWLRPLLALLPDVPLQWYWRELAALEKLGTCVCVPWLRPLLALLPDVPLQWYWRELAALEKLGTCVCVPWLRPLLALLPDVPLQWYWRELAALEKLGTCVCVPWLRPLLALLPDVPLQWYWRELAALEKLGTCVCVPWLRPLLALLPDVPLQWYWRELAALEKLDMGLTCSNMFDRHDPIGLSAFTCIVAMCVQMLISTMVLVLINAPYMGLKLPCFRLWMRKLHALKVESDGEALEEQGLTPGAEYFEKVPENKEVGIKIVNVSKMYGNQCALKNVSLDVYKGEITVLLGHNGAGKTTLMSIITGMLTPTSGKVFVDGIDIAQSGRRALRQLGLCPQHNLFVPHLTVLEHVVMFTVLKGGSWSTAKESSRELLEQLGIGDKCGAKSEQLSGGMRRRLQLACALAGGSGVLVLDEPTSGLDVETRRGLWDLLLSLRGTRTVVLSTHFMEEADALGERVAALHRGTLRCHATTMHLKRAVGTGYRLSFTTIGYPKEEAVTSVVTSHVPDATLKGKTLNSLTYNLPAKYNAKFPALFSNLETSRPELGIDSIGVGVSTIEEVFLKLCSDSDAMASEDMLDDTTTELQFEKRTGFGLYVQQVVALLWRQLRFVIDKRTSYFLVYFFLPILLTVLITIASNNDSSYDNKERSINLDLDLYDKVSGARILYKVNDTDTLRRVVGAPPFLEPATDLNDAILRIGKSGIKKYSNYLIGIEVNETDAKVWYSTVYLHTAPVGLRLLGRYMAARALPAAGAHTLAARNWPLAHSAAHVPAVEPKSSVGAVLYSSGIVFSTLATIMNVLPLVIKERAAGTRALHALAGCAPELHWLAAALAHTALYAAPVVLGTVAATAVADADHTFLQADFLGTIALVMLLGLLAFLPVAYLPTFRCGERATTLFLSVFIIVFGIGTPSIRSAIEMFEEKQKHPITWFLMRCADYLAPPHTYMVAATRTALTARVNALCQLNRDRCPNLVVAEPGFDAAACCVNEKPRCYFCFEDGSPLSAMLFLVFQVFLYFLVVEVVERGWLCAVWERLSNARYAARAAPDADDLARAERVYVANAIALPTDLIQDAMLVNDLHKNYACMFRKPCNAVRGVSFSVKKGECFGLLGVNGAGKSTTFKMLTAEVPPTRGNIYANGHHLGFLPDKYVSTLGYCPQHGGLDGALTGRQHLALLLALRGLRAPDARAAAREWTAAVGLTAYADRQTRTYSGGCARRLAAAAALCGGADTALLDEPSAGVDVAARRRLWAAVRRALRTKRSLVISSHSMEEMEALCDRIAIMAEGRVRALGAAAALRAAHAAGHAVRVKLRPAARAHGDATDSSVPPTEAQLQQLKSAFRDVFNCTLKDEHTTMLHYHINESMSYSNLFGALEALRGDFPELLEDYSVTETTLEEVFLSFAKEPALEAVVTSQTQPHNI